MNQKNSKGSNYVNVQMPTEVMDLNETISFRNFLFFQLNLFVLINLMIDVKMHIDKLDVIFLVDHHLNGTHCFRNTYYKFNDAN